MRKAQHLWGHTKDLNISDNIVDYNISNISDDGREIIFNYDVGFLNSL